jgi:thiamine-phosphate diphosphorylase / hydroxyethylthiazole kinase
MPIAIVRKLLPKGAIIGASCNNEAEVEKALADGADYIGIGAVWATTTKALDKPVIGVRNVGAMLELLDGTPLKAVAIGKPLFPFSTAKDLTLLVKFITGGIKATNLLRTLHGSVSRTNHALDGVAIVSEIMASPQPKEAATRLRGIIQQFRNSRSIERAFASSDNGYITEQISNGVAHLFEHMKAVSPLVHQVLRYRFLCTGGESSLHILNRSPIMLQSHNLPISLFLLAPVLSWRRLHRKCTTWLRYAMLFWLTLAR